LFDNNNFDKWLLSGSLFEIDIFKHSFHPQSYDPKTTRETGTTDDLVMIQFHYHIMQLLIRMMR